MAVTYMSIAFYKLKSHDMHGGQSVLLNIVILGIVLIGIYVLIYRSGKFKIYFKHKDEVLQVNSREYSLKDGLYVYIDGNAGDILRVSYRVDKRDLVLSLPPKVVRKIHACLTS